MLKGTRRKMDTNSIIIATSKVHLTAKASYLKMVLVQVLFRIIIIINGHILMIRRVILMISLATLSTKPSTHMIQKVQN